LSNSERKSYKLTVGAPQDAVVQVLDGQDNVVGGPGSTTLPQGVYSVRAEIAGRIAEQMVRLTRDRTINVNPPRFSSAPIAEATNSHEYYSYPAQDLSTKKSAPALGPGPHTSSLFVFIRTPRQELYHGETLAQGLVLLDAAGNVASTFAAGETVVDTHGFVAFTADVTPGAYRLVSSGDGSRELGLEVPAGWQLQVFLIFRERVLLESATLFMARPNVGFRREDEVASDVDLALKALQNRAAPLPEAAKHRLLEGKFDNPMLGLLGAHLVLRLPKPERWYVDMVLGNLLGLIGPEPDVLALQLMAAERFDLPPGPVRLSRPPMLRAGFEGVTSVAAKMPDVIEEGSLFEQVSTRLYADSPWVTWEPLVRDAEVPPEAPAVPLPPPGWGWGEERTFPTPAGDEMTEGAFRMPAPAPAPEPEPEARPGPEKVQWSWLHAALLDSLQKRSTPFEPARLAARLQVSQRVLNRALDELRTMVRDPSALEEHYGEVPESLPPF
jgi:hypothetical protein